MTSMWIRMTVMEVAVSILQIYTSEDDQEGFRTLDDDNFMDDTDADPDDSDADPDDSDVGLDDSDVDPDDSDVDPDDSDVDPDDSYGSGNEHSPIYATQAEEGEEDEAIKELFHMGKDKKKNEKSAAETALLVENVMAELKVVAEEDAELYRQGKPATNKLEKLSLLTDEATSSRVSGSWRLTLLKNWLEPLPDGNLPDINIRTAVLKFLNDAEEGEEDEAIKELFHMGKDKKKNEKSAAETALLVENVMAELKVVAEEDAELYRQGKPATNKLEKLSLLTDVLSKMQLHQEFLDHGGLTLLKNWLEPLPDGSLPDINIRTAVLKILNDFPIDLQHSDRRGLLKRSGLGKVIMFLSMSAEETTVNQKLAKELVDKWVI
ncbi:UNVERIFIED_CONTAM: protein IWS11, partial [Sesamum radiatum]